MKVACIQQPAKAVWDYAEVKEDILSMLREAGDNGAEMAVVPECAYPAYFLGLDEEALKAALDKTDDLLADVAALAKEYKMYIAMGLALEDGEDLFNAALMFDDNGEVIGKAYKSNLWHFDYRWFTAGTEFKAFDTKWGKMGLMVCADGRIPEIARILKLQGAKVIVDTVNLVAAAADPKALMNQQYAFILPTRAMENKVWLIVSDKCGVEAKCAGYLGRSMFISPEGQIVADCPPDEPMILYYDVDPDQAGELPKRKPYHYKAMTVPTEELPIYARMQEKMTAAESEIMVSAVQYKSEVLADYIERAKEYIKACELAESRVIFLPRFNGFADILAIAEALRSSIKFDSVVALSCGTTKPEGICFSADRVFGMWEKGSEPSVVETPRGALSMIFDDDAYIPEIPRTAMLKGAEILLWADSEVRPMNMKVAQTRAAENKMFVIRTSCAADDISNVINPGGGAVTSTFKGTDQAAGTLIFRFEGLAKSVITGTNIVTGRKPECYGEIVK